MKPSERIKQIKDAENARRAKLGDKMPGKEVPPECTDIEAVIAYLDETGDTMARKIRK